MIKMVVEDEEVELIARLFHAATSISPYQKIENIVWPPRDRNTLKRYLNRAKYVRDELKLRGWTSP